ncbi:FAST kinase domain-containing protein 4 [Anguilla anguilla]|uniref:FAST kinase domain-containing protein 4 n=1 Tax=Anguilla anguilla TaxID=7936 RepID=A0A9D3S657_ANGAN|nr:FAST kinase domain-containing protein 4 [Anguilla anguilla]KAG5857024.1 hypothetical protein ANANG_G00014190 [Anguilla anguilla]
MTTRLLGRWARLLATRCPIGASSAAAHLSPRLAPEESARVQSLGLQLHSQWRAMCEGHSLIKEDDKDLSVKQTELEQLVGKAGSPEDVLQLWADRGGGANQAAIGIIRLTKLSVEKGGLDCKDLLHDHRLLDMLSKVSSEVATVWNGNLVSLLRSLSQLGVAPGAVVMHTLQTEALWRVRRFTYRQLAFLADWASSRPGSQEQELQNNVLKQLELRWTELADARTASVLMARAGHLSPSLMDKLEDKALELAEKFNAEDIRRVALSLASQGRRSVPLLRALSYHLQQKPSTELNTPLLLDVAFACGKLNFKQTQVFQRIAAELLPRKAELSSSDVMRCAKSFAYLKWLHLPLFECFTEHYLENSQKYSTMQVCSLLLSLARLNFQPSKAEEFYGKVHEALEGTVKDLEPYLQTDLVWSLCILQQAKPQYLQSVLDPIFHRKLTGGNPSRTENYRLKLLHIAATAQLENLCPSEASAVLSQPVSALTQESRSTPLQTSLKEALQSLTESSGGTCRAGVNTIYGWTLDGELVVDSDNKPMDLLAIEAPHLCVGGGGSPMPQGARRVAFLAGEFPNYNSRSKDLLGRFAMQRRHLQLAGFLTVEVPYFEWQELKSDWQRVAYLKDKLGKAVAEEMAK